MMLKKQQVADGGDRDQTGSRRQKVVHTVDGGECVEEPAVWQQRWLVFHWLCQ